MTLGSIPDSGGMQSSALLPEDEAVRESFTAHWFERHIPEVDILPLNFGMDP